jgi:hypothetical protein
MAMYTPCPECGEEVKVNDIAPKGFSVGSPPAPGTEVTCPNKECAHSFVPKAPNLYLESKKASGAA